MTKDRFINVLWEKRGIVQTTNERKKTKNEKKTVTFSKWSGLAPLPSDTFEDQYQELCKKLFADIEEKKEHY
jgi:hypothetical protein